MLRKIIFILIFITINVSLNAFSHFDKEDFFSLNREFQGVKQIIEIQRRHGIRTRTIQHFDKEGFLLRTYHYRRNNIQASYIYEYYFVSDSVLKIKQTWYRYTIPQANGERLFVFHYNTSGQVYKIYSYSFSRGAKMLSSINKNFIYKNGQLQRYESYPVRLDFFRIIVFTYSENKRTRQMLTVDKDSMISDTGKEVFIYENGKLTDFIRVGAEGEAIISGEPLWSRERPVVHIRFSNFDRQGNWRRSHFITESGRTLRSRRTIEYW